MSTEAPRNGPHRGLGWIALAAVVSAMALLPFAMWWYDGVRGEVACGGCTTSLLANVEGVFVDGRWYRATVCLDGECEWGDYFHGDVLNPAAPSRQQGPLLEQDNQTLWVRVQRQGGVSSPWAEFTLGRLDATGVWFDPRDRLVTLTLTDLETGDVVLEVEEQLVDWEDWGGGGFLQPNCEPCFRGTLETGSSQQLAG